MSPELYTDEPRPCQRPTDARKGPVPRANKHISPHSGDIPVELKTGPRVYFIWRSQGRGCADDVRLAASLLIRYAVRFSMLCCPFSYCNPGPSRRRAPLPCISAGLRYASWRWRPPWWALGFSRRTEVRLRSFSFSTKDTINEPQSFALIQDATTIGGMMWHRGPMNGGSIRGYFKKHKAAFDDVINANV